MTYKDKYFKLFIRFIKENGLTNTITENSINGNYGLNRIIELSLPINIAKKYFALHCKHFSTYKRKIEFWQEITFNEFKNDIMLYIANDDKIPKRLIVNALELDKLYPNNKEYFIDLIHNAMYQRILDINNFYNTKIN